jgi:hypothetical protein
MPMPKTLVTKKLFFKKYPFKVGCEVRGGSDIIRHGVDWTLEYARTEGQSDVRRNKLRTWGMLYNPRQNQIDYADLEKFILTVQQFLSNEKLKFRVEGSRFNIYCLDKDMYNDLNSNLYPWVRELTAPKTDQDLSYLLSNRTKILVDKLPYDTYMYKVMLRPGTGGLSTDKRSKFLTWAQRYTQDCRIRIGASTGKWLRGNSQYCQAPFIYVKDANVLTLVELYLGNKISSVDEYVLRSTVDLV